MLISLEEFRKLNRTNVVVGSTGNPELPEEWDFEPTPELVFDDDLDASKKSIIEISPSAFVEFSVKVPDKKEQTRVPFSFDKRRYLRLPYDTPSKRTLYKCGRQVEKTEVVSSICRRADGSPVAAGDVKVGDVLATMSSDGSHMTTGTVTWVSQRYKKPCVQIRSRQGHITRVATTHPMRSWDSWKDGGSVSAGDRLAVVRRCGEFTGTLAPPKERIRLTAYLIGDGSIGGNDVDGDIGFTQMSGVVLNEFLSDVILAGGTFRLRDAQKGPAKQVVLHRNGLVRGWMTEDGLLGHGSSSKFAPEWVWKLSREDTALFVNRLWSTDGHVKQNTRSKYSLEYCSVSERLIKDVQALLWKFGIPSSIRKNWPNYWKSKGIVQFAHILRVETQDGVRRFLTEIACLGKSEGVAIPKSDENNNRDTYPIEINNLIRRIIDSRGRAGRFGKYAEKGVSLRTAGLRETLKYPPTWKKVQKYVHFFKSDIRYDQNLVKELESHIDTDLYWDEVEDVVHIGEKECVDFQVEGTHNFVCDGFITHNSTLLGNKSLAYCCINNSFNILYVSPTNQQTKTFSQDRLKEPIETSNILKAWTTSKLSDNVFLKKFINRSQITLRYAYHNADRVRGIPADCILIDELQDIITDNIPIIEECASHSPHKIFIYSGTPKSTDNPIEKYWTDYSTQNEWAVPCACKGGEGGRYWNILGEENIGKESLICSNCGAALNPMSEGSQWAMMNASILNSDKITEPFEGYRIPQLMVPWIEWTNILHKHHTMSRAAFFNEVLGLSYDSGSRPLVKQDIIDNCREGMKMDAETLNAIKSSLGGSSPVFAGIDWGSGENSYTVLSLGAYLNERFTIFYIHRFEGAETEPLIQHDLIEQILRQWNVTLAGCDYGGGLHSNDFLQRKFGKEKIVKYQYSQPSVKVRWEPDLHRYLVHRTEIMSDVFNAIKRRNVLSFIDWSQFQEPFGNDMLNIFSEFNEQQRQIQYKKSPDCTDDSFHSILLCFLVSMLRIPRFDVLNPTAKTGTSSED